MILISHADDFGLDPAISDGIQRAGQSGRLSEVSAVVTGHLEPSSMVNWQLPATMAIGLHFNLTEGRPLSALTAIPALVDWKGRFYPWPIFWARLSLGRFPAEQIETELKAQIDRFERLFWYFPRHIDSHHHIHFAPPVWQVIKPYLTTGPIRSIRRAARLLFGPTLDPRPYVINRALRRLPAPSSTAPRALIDVRWLPQPTLAQSIEFLEGKAAYELIWHLATGHRFPWRTAQQGLFEAKSTWHFRDRSDVRLGTYADLETTSGRRATKR